MTEPNPPRAGEVEFLAPAPGPRRWDVVLTAFEPLEAVTGGIGSYHRLLIDALTQAGLSVLVLTRGINAGWQPPAGAESFLVDSLVETCPWNFVGLEHQRFALHCHLALTRLQADGHSFAYTEFSDYGGDGFYALRAHRAGTLDLGTAAVRLHSPDLMLVEDNGGSLSAIDPFKRDVIDRELSAYEDCDVIVYGGEAMRDRVAGLAAQFGLALADKFVKCPHPYPRHLFAADAQAAPVAEVRATTQAAILAANRLAERKKLGSARFVGIFGRIEDRKGQYQFLARLIDSDAFVAWLHASDVHFLIAGHNVLDHVGNYRLGDLYTAIFRRNLSNRFHFTGRVPQDVLAQFSRAVSGYIFPSIFENYPNALLEVLPTTKPIALSGRGCMAEITRGFRRVEVFDPLAVDIERIIAFLNSLPPADAPLDRAEFDRRTATLAAREAEMVGFYRHAAAAGPPPRVAGANLRVGFVIPVYQVWDYLDETLRSVRAAAAPSDQIVVVDDGSDAEAVTQIKRLCAEHGVRLILSERNGGPAAARLLGVRALDTDLIQFCDADDLLNARGIAAARAAFRADPALTMLTGIMHCFQDNDHYWVPRNGHVWTAAEAHFAHSGSMFRRPAIEAALAVPHDRLDRNEDWLTSLLILGQGGKARMLPIVTYHYRRFAGTRSTRNLEAEARINRRLLEVAFANWTFPSGPETARVRRLLPLAAQRAPAALALPSAPTGPYSPDRPLRHQLADRLYFRLVRFGPVERVAGRVRTRLLSRTPER